MATNDCLCSSTEVVEMLSHTNYEASNCKRKVKTSFGSPGSGFPTIGVMGLRIRDRDWILACLRECLGTTKIPLAWIVREGREIEPHADDPATNCVNPVEELIGRAPHFVTPIANPGQASIEAALNPDQSDFIYFVAKSLDPRDGHNFAVTLDEHNQNVAAYRALERAAE